MSTTLSSRLPSLLSASSSASSSFRLRSSSYRFSSLPLRSLSLSSSSSLPLLSSSSSLRTLLSTASVIALASQSLSTSSTCSSSPSSSIRSSPFSSSSSPSSSPAAADSSFHSDDPLPPPLPPSTSPHSPESVVIIGSGSAGLTAAIYSSRAALSPLVVEGLLPGGQLTATSDVENFPGFERPIVGPQLMETMRKQAERFGTRYVQGEVVSVDWDTRPISLSLADGRKIYTKALIIATGAVAKWLGVEGEQRYQGRGVSACATCDGFFFRNRDVAVVGGGDTALEEASFLTRFARSVTLVHRRDAFRASAAMQKKAEKNPKIKVIWNSVVKEIKGDDKNKVCAIVLESKKHGKHGKEGEKEEKEVRELPVQGVFIAIGHQPNSGLFAGKLPLDPQGYIQRPSNGTATGIPGVFVAGDVSDNVYRQAITAAGMGCMAAIDAQHYIEKLEDEGK